jgi:two-component system, OmpR family, sensor histidine kinase KdpD
VLVDDLAHSNIPGNKNPKRWQDVEELLDAGITVFSTVNIQHLESLNDVVAQITGIEQHETVPDEVVRGATQVDLVDITPQALRRRLSHGYVYAAERIDAALSNYFRTGNLTALRELALLWLADEVDVANHPDSVGVGGTGDKNCRRGGNSVRHNIFRVSEDLAARHRAYELAADGI